MEKVSLIRLHIDNNNNSCCRFKRHQQQICFIYVWMFAVTNCVTQTFKSGLCNIFIYVSNGNVLYNNNRRAPHSTHADEKLSTIKTWWVWRIEKLQSHFWSLYCHLFSPLITFNLVVITLLQFVRRSGFDNVQISSDRKQRRVATKINKRNKRNLRRSFRREKKKCRNTICIMLVCFAVVINYRWRRYVNCWLMMDTQRTSLFILTT